jgi:6-phosphogluconate dehydrogenase
MDSQPAHIGVVGLGRMGRRIALNLLDHGHAVVGYDIDAAVNRLPGAEEPVTSLADLAARLATPRVIFLIIPAGPGIDDAIDGLLPHLAPGDVVLECGNSRFEDAAPQAARCAERGVEYLDIGVSGGVSGARHGACLTVGGPEATFARVEPILRDIAVPGGCAHVGPHGWGHLVKLVHNGIEYGMLQAIAEGVHVLRAAAEHSGTRIDLAEICETWNRGSIIESRLLRDTVAALELIKDPNPVGAVGGGETGQWVAALAKDLGVAAPALEAALAARAASHANPSYAGALLAAIRNVFGEHERQGRDPLR